MTTIRQATAADVPAVVDMACAFYETTHYTAWADPHPESIHALAQGMADDHVLLVAEKDGELQGMVALFVVPFMFNANVNAAFECAYWVKPEARGSRAGWQLLEAVAPACKAKGCASVTMVKLENSPPQVALMYERLGFVCTESSYTRKL